MNDVTEQGQAGAAAREVAERIAVRWGALELLDELHLADAAETIQQVIGAALAERDAEVARHVERARTEIGRRVLAESKLFAAEEELRRVREALAQIADPPKPTWSVSNAKRAVDLARAALAAAPGGREGGTG